jgi:4-hydroxy-tetrahydrodipicolinate synthase
MNTSTPKTIRELEGYISALPTPFRDGAIDEAAFGDLCEWQIEQGISGLVVGGTTGEAPTLQMAEMRRLVGRAVKIARGRVPIIAGACSNATSHAVELAAQAEAEGADCLLAVTPYYNRPSQEGVFRHFQAIRCATALPLILYDVPSRTGLSLTDETVLRLAALPKIVGLKDRRATFSVCGACAGTSERISACSAATMPRPSLS